MLVNNVLFLSILNNSKTSLLPPLLSQQFIPFDIFLILRVWCRDKGQEDGEMHTLLDKHEAELSSATEIHGSLLLETHLLQVSFSTFVSPIL